MKIGSLPNYLVQVYPASWEEPPEDAPRFAGIVTVVLNVALRIVFVPDPGDDVPPSAQVGEPTTVAQTRRYELATAGCAVTPSATRAGEAERVGPADAPGVVFHVTPEEFARFTDELEELARLTAEAEPRLHRADVLDRQVMRFVDGPVLSSPLLDPDLARAVGRDPAPRGR